MILSTTQSFKSSFCSCPQRKRLRAVPAHSLLKLSRYVMLLAAMLGVSSVLAMDDELNNPLTCNMTNFKRIVLEKTNTCSTCEGVKKQIKCPACLDKLTQREPQRQHRYDNDYESAEMKVINELETTLEQLPVHTAIKDLPELKLIGGIAQAEIQAFKTYIEKLGTSRLPHDEQLRRKLEEEKMDIGETVAQLTKVFTDLPEIYKIHKEVKAEIKAKYEENADKLNTLRKFRNGALARNRSAYDADCIRTREASKKAWKIEYKLKKLMRQKLEIDDEMHGLTNKNKPASADSMEKKLAKLRPSSWWWSRNISGKFTGNKLRTNEMERLGFAEKCTTCKDSGLETCERGNPNKNCITSGCNHYYWSPWNFCKKPCTACVKNTHEVYLSERLYNSQAPNGYYEEGTKCQLQAIDNKYWNGIPKATIRIDGNTITNILSTRLLRTRDPSSPKMDSESSPPSA